MPKENKKRGRRAEAAAKKRKHDDFVDEQDGDVPPAASASSGKRRKSADDPPDDVETAHVAIEDGVDAAYPPLDKPFFGMLDDEEQEYFKRADDLLEANAFGEPEERTLFLENVYREADGKELKIANSQSCSRLMERLIQLSTPAQLKNLFRKFSGNFIHLMAHRFASHCVEQLFSRAAPFVTNELLAPNAKTDTDNDEIYVSMENLFLHAIAELDGSVGFMLTDRFASHVFRILLLVLAGESTEAGATKGLLASRKKEGVTVNGVGKADADPLKQSKTVPDSFSEALEKLIGDSVSGLDTDKLRALATNPNANPVLQLLIRLELTHFGRQHAKDAKSIFKTLLPDEPVTSENDSGKFISSLIYDTIGSHLVETIVECAPGKLWKGMYKSFFRERLASFARNEIAGYVVCRILERLGKDDLLDAHDHVAPQIPSLLERGRTVVVQTLIERCAIRDIDTKAIAVQIDASYGKGDDFDLRRLLQLEAVAQTNGLVPHDSVQSSAENSTSSFARDAGPAKAHFNILAQTMILVPGSLSALILDALVNLDPPTLLRMSKDPIASRTLQAALSTKNSSVIQTRKIVQHFYGHVGELALDKAASHVVDCIWEGTHGLAFIRERIAEELAENEGQLRESPYGRGVWKNWKMDIYKRKRGEWVRQSKIKASNDGFQSFSEIDKNIAKTENGKTPLQLARERHAKAKADKGQPSGRSATKSVASGASPSQTSEAPAAAA